MRKGERPTAKSLSWHRSTTAALDRARDLSGAHGLRRARCRIIEDWFWCYQQAAVNCVAGQFRGGAEPQFVHQVGFVKDYGAARNVEDIGDAADSPPFSH